MNTLKKRSAKINPCKICSWILPTKASNQTTKMFHWKINIMLFLLLLQVGCSQPPATEAIDSDIAQLTNDIKKAEDENSKYVGGLIKALIEYRIAIMNNTKAMLEQKKAGINKFITIKYTVNGNAYTPPDSIDEIINGINNDLVSLENDISKSQQEDDKYAGGLIKAIIGSKIATMKNTHALLMQKKLLIKHGIPWAAAFPGGQKMGKQDDMFVPTPGKDIDKM